MRYLTYFTDQQNRIDVHNSWTGTEQIFYNGQLMSKATTIFGTTHRFSVIEGGESVAYVLVVSYSLFVSIACDLYRNGVALLLSQRCDADLTLNKIKTRKSIYSLLTIIGAAFLGLAVYDFIIAGYNLKGVHLVPTLIFGIIWPVLGIKRLRALSNAEEQARQAEHQNTSL